jgi:tripartite-type tricarboxylate transporter receptor subunit TctC
MTASAQRTRVTLIARIYRIGVVIILCAFAAQAYAQSAYPNKPIKYIVVFAPGGTTDILARLIAPRLAEALGQPVVVENRPGAGGSVGSELLAKSAPDGYTIGGGTISSHAINVTLYSKLAYDPVKDFAPVTMLATLPNMLIVHPSLNVSNVKELIELLKANPNKYSFGSAGNGTSQHISGELFKTMAGVQMQHIPYKGSGPMIPDLLAGTIAMSFENMTTAYPPVKGGRLRALAVTSSARSSAAPEVPPMAEAGLPGYDISSWQALFAPAGTPKEIVSRLHLEVAKILRLPEVVKRIQELGAEPGGMPPEELAALIKNDIPRLGKIVKDSGAKVD